MLLERLQAIVLPAPPASQPFATLRGQLTMPIEGKPINRFGAIRNADLRWRGWLIPAEQGDPLSAILDPDYFLKEIARCEGNVAAAE